MESLISAQVMVVDTDKDRIWVKANSCDSCETCNSGKGCRSRLFTMFSSQDAPFKLNVAAEHKYKIGDTLALSCANTLPLLIITVLYFVPMLFFVILTAVGHYSLQLSEPRTIGLAVAGFLLYYIFLYVVKPVAVWQKLLSFNISKI